MSLINDVKADVRALDCSEAGLMKFGRTVGGVFLLLATAVFIFRSVTNAVIAFATVGSLLVLFGMLAPKLLARVYRVWMGTAFTLGWIVSRVILAFFFFLIITPVALLARLTGKKFLNTDFRTGRQSYWIEKSTQSRYDRMS